jgi:hypothetical protein
VTDDAQIVDGEIVAEPGNQLERRDSGEVNLFRTDDPAEVIEKATAIANALKSVVKSQGLIQIIQGKEHPKVEAWQTLGGLLSVTAVCTHTEPVTDRHGKPAYMATVEARFRGEVVGKADAMCSTSENRWSKADDYALLSMAQTRATSKALKGPLGWVMKLAGYQTTPAEEMPQDGAPAEPQPAQQAKTIDPAWAVKILDKVREKGMTLGQVRELLALVYGDRAKTYGPDDVERAVASLSPDNAKALEQELGS